MAKTVFYWIKQLLLIVIITLVVTILVIQTYDIRDVSMEPTFDARGNRVLVFITPYLFAAQPGHGHIVILDSRVDRDRNIWDRFRESPIIAFMQSGENEYLWVKRVVGLPGDRLEFKNGEVYRNGNKLEEEYVRGTTEASILEVVVPEHCVYVLGDNRGRSTDSRKIGPVPVDNIQGRVVMRIFPFGSIGFY